MINDDIVERMEYHHITLICPRCGKTEMSKSMVLNKDEAIIRYVHCPDCALAEAIYGVRL